MSAAAAKRPLFRGMWEDLRGLMGAPRDLWIIYAVKLLESVSYFAVLGVLILYLHDDLRLGDEMSGLVFGSWGTLVSLLSSYCPENGAHSTGVMWTIVFATTIGGPLIALAFASVIRGAEKARLATSAASVAG